MTFLNTNAKMEEGAGFDLPYYITGKGGQGFTPR